LGIDNYVDDYGDKGYGGYDANGRPIFHSNLKPDSRSTTSRNSASAP
jgi:hypothetical protein